MRLIDADALKYRRKDYGGYDDVSEAERKEGIMFLLKEDIDNAPTIDIRLFGEGINETNRCRCADEKVGHGARM